MARKIVFREVPKDPPPTGEINMNLWRALCDREGSEGYEDREIYLDEGDIGWLSGYLAGTPSSEEKTEVYQLIKAINQLKQVQVAWSL